MYIKLNVKILTLFLGLSLVGCSGVTEFEKSDKLAEAEEEEDYSATEPVATTGTYLTVLCDPKVEDRNNMLYCVAHDRAGKKVTNSCLNDWQAHKAKSTKVVKGELLPDKSKYNARFNLASDQHTDYSVKASGGCGQGLYDPFGHLAGEEVFDIYFAATYIPDYQDGIAGATQQAVIGDKTPLAQVDDLCGFNGIISEEEFVRLKASSTSNDTTNNTFGNTIDQMATTSYGTLSRQPVSLSSGNIDCFKEFGDMNSRSLYEVRKYSCVMYSIKTRNGNNMVYIQDSTTPNNPLLTQLATTRTCR